MKYVVIFMVGIVILLSAIALNLIATKLNIQTWYDFLKEPSKARALDYIWLFGIYPLFLGLVAYYTIKLTSNL